MINVTPQQCAAVYDMLCTLPPFNSIPNMPTAEEIEWRCVNRMDIYGQYQALDPHVITVSTALVGHLETLIKVIAHEMVHLWQVMDLSVTKAQHNANWYKKARKVCNSLGYDPRSF